MTEALFPVGCTCSSYGHGLTMTRVHSPSCPLHSATLPELQRMTDEELRASVNEFTQDDPPTVLGHCPHGVDLDREFCPRGCRV